MRNEETRRDRSKRKLKLTTNFPMAKDKHVRVYQDVVVANLKPKHHNLLISNCLSLLSEHPKLKSPKKNNLQ